jgi:hypothetical protein
VKYCPKCEQTFYTDFTYEFCAVHQKEYYDWLNKSYSPEIKCKCGSDQYTDGFLNMIDPPLMPAMKVYRCAKCDEVRLEVSDEREVRIMVRE